MTPRTDGYYLSERIISEDWHAGVKMTDEYYRYLKFFPDGYWLRRDYRTADLDFMAFVRSFDLDAWRAHYKTLRPPTSAERDGGDLFEFGTFVAKGRIARLTFYSGLGRVAIPPEGWLARLLFRLRGSPATEHTIEIRVIISSDGRGLGDDGDEKPFFKFHESAE